jgi:hypothetical protein
MKLLTTYDKKSGIYSYEGVPLLIGSYQNLRIKNVLLRGVVHRVENADQPVIRKMYEVEAYVNPAIIQNQDPYTSETMTDGVKNYLADKISKGLKMVDSDGTVLVDIVDVKKEAAYRKFIFQNRLAEVLDNERKKVTVRLRVVTEKYDDVFLFMGEKSLRINDNFYLNFGDFEMPITVTNFKEI